MFSETEQQSKTSSTKGTFNIREWTQITPSTQLVDFNEILFVGILSCIQIFHIKKPVHKKTAEIFSTFLLGAYLPVLKEHFVFSIS